MRVNKRYNENDRISLKKLKRRIVIRYFSGFSEEKVLQKNLPGYARYMSKQYTG